MTMEFNRIFTNDLERWRSNAHRKPLIVKGARQVGKTHLLKTFAAKNFRRSHYINFELNTKARQLFATDLDPVRIVRDLSFLLETEINPAQDVLIFDEVQLAPQGITSLKYFNEDLPGCAVCAAGSLIGLTLGADSFPVGNVDILSLYPMTFAEFLEATEQTLLLEYLESQRSGSAPSEVAHQKLWQLLTQYFVCGGMPAIVAQFCEYRDDLFKATKIVRAQQVILLETYVNDFAKHCGRNNALHLDRVFRSVPSQMANSIDAKAPRFQFKDVVPGVSQYAPLASAFDWLKGAGLILRVPIIDTPLPPLMARVSENRFKAYLHDVGLLGALADIKVDGILGWQFSNFKGYFAENFVAQEFMAAGARALYSWREGTAEIEFLIDRGTYALPVEVKSGNYKHAKSLRVFSERYNPAEKILLSGFLGAKVALQGVRTLPMYLAGRIIEEGSRI